MATINARNLPDGMLTTAPLAAPGVTPNVVDTQRTYAALVFDLRATGTSAAVSIEHQRAADGVWCLVSSTPITVATAAGAAVQVLYPVGVYRANVTAVTGTVDVGYSCAAQLRG